jgi:hypothetical protein
MARSKSDEPIRTDRTYTFQSFVNAKKHVLTTFRQWQEVARGISVGAMWGRKSRGHRNTVGMAIILFSFVRKVRVLSVLIGS